MEAGSTGAETAVAPRMIEPSIGNALLHFTPLLVFPPLVCAALWGGWWLLILTILFTSVEYFDKFFGVEEQSIDPNATHEKQLFLYKLSLWLWAVSWPVTFVFALWQILVSDHLATWEVFMMAGMLAGVGQSIFIVGHELVHRRAAWERRLGELLLACASYPHYATEHIYFHHPLVCTPGDAGSAPKGVSLWQYLPRELKSNLVSAWRFERTRLARRRLPVWHYTNPFWRYALQTAGWYALVFWMGGPWAVLMYAGLCSIVIVSMKVSNYVQHYGLRRIRLPGGRYETVKARHAWSADYKFSNWFYYNMQRHADHHAATNRRYPLLQYHGGDESPQLPGTYVQMGGLAMSPRRWFKTIDPLLDRQRAHFYPEIEDWSAYDSPAYAACPDAFDAIAEIHAAAPRMAGWINRTPTLLDGLKEREFTDLDLPDGFGPDPEFEAVARRGLARVYWTRELGASEMREQLADLPVQDASEAVEVAREWSNGKVFQVGMHTMRGSLAPTEAATALSNVAAASMSAVLSAVEDDSADSGAARAEGGIAVVVLGALASGEAAPGAALDVLFVHGGGPAELHETLCRRFDQALRALSRDNLLLASIPRERKERPVRSLDGFREHYLTTGSAAELLELTRARCVFVAGDADIAERFEAARREALARGAARNAVIAELRETSADASEPGLLALDDMRGGARDLERAARLLQMTHAGDVPELLAPDAASVFRTAGDRGLLPDGAAARLAAAEGMWRNLRGILRLVADDGFAVDAATARVKSVIAQSCGMDDFDALADAIRATASRAAGDVHALSAEAPGR
ncbi:MAG: hypothetical protein F4057_05620 [Acidobacteria bacterium]|nr:hypothetical protein [Acidobacteriota bacterium]